MQVIPVFITINLRKCIILLNFSVDYLDSSMFLFTLLNGKLRKTLGNNFKFNLLLNEHNLYEACTNIRDYI